MKALLIDLDGVLYVGGSAVSGAREAMSWVQHSGLGYLFLTNTTSKPRGAIVDKLAEMGFRITSERILTPPVAAANWMKSQRLKRLALFVPEATRAEFASFELVESENTTVDAVIVGDLGEAWDFATLNRAFRYLSQAVPPKLIALGMTRYWRAPDGLRLDTAPFVVALSHASGVEPIVLGKPAKMFFAAACEILGVAETETLMIGDDIAADVKGAQDAGISGVLVRTGKYRETDEKTGIKPCAVLDSIAKLPEWWTDQGWS